MPQRGSFRRRAPDEIFPLVETFLSAHAAGLAAVQAVPLG